MTYRGRVEAAQPAVRVRDGVEQGGHVRGAGEDAGDEAFGHRRMAVSAPKQIPAALRKRQVDVQAVAVAVGERLGHKGGEQAVLCGDCLDRHFEGDEIIRRTQRVCVSEIHLMLAGAALVVGAFRPQPHLLEGEADLPADVFPLIQRGDIVEAAAVVRGHRRLTGRVGFEQVELALGAHVDDITAGGRRAIAVLSRLRV